MHTIKHTYDINMNFSLQKGSRWVDARADKIAILRSTSSRNPAKPAPTCIALPQLLPLVGDSPSVGILY